MPKRRVYKRDSKGRFASTGAKARRKAAKRGPIPMGKNVLLYHHTTPENADSIVASQKFKTGPYNKEVHFTQALTEKAFSSYGSAIVGVKVPRKNIHDVANWGGPLGSGRIKAIKVRPSKLRGVKIKRVR